MPAPKKKPSAPEPARKKPLPSDSEHEPAPRPGKKGKKKVSDGSEE